MPFSSRTLLHTLIITIVLGLFVSICEGQSPRKQPNEKGPGGENRERNGNRASALEKKPLQEASSKSRNDEKENGKPDKVQGPQGRGKNPMTSEKLNEKVGKDVRSGDKNAGNIPPKVHPKNGPDKNFKSESKVNQQPVQQKSKTIANNGRGNVKEGIPKSAPERKMSTNVNEKNDITKKRQGEAIVNRKDSIITGSNQKMKGGTIPVDKPGNKDRGLPGNRPRNGDKGTSRGARRRKGKFGGSESKSLNAKNYRRIRPGSGKPSSETESGNEGEEGDEYSDDESLSYDDNEDEEYLESIPDYEIEGFPESIFGSEQRTNQERQLENEGNVIANERKMVMENTNEEETIDRNDPENKRVAIPEVPDNIRHRVSESMPENEKQSKHEHRYLENKGVITQLGVEPENMEEGFREIMPKHQERQNAEKIHAIEEEKNRENGLVNSKNGFVKDESRNMPEKIPGSIRKEAQRIPEYIPRNFPSNEPGIVGGGLPINKPALEIVPAKDAPVKAGEGILGNGRGIERGRTPDSISNGVPRGSGIENGAMKTMSGSVAQLIQAAPKQMEFSHLKLSPESDFQKQDLANLKQTHANSHLHVKDVESRIRLGEPSQQTKLFQEQKMRKGSSGPFISVVYTPPPPLYQQPGETRTLQEQRSELQGKRLPKYEWASNKIPEIQDLSMKAHENPSRQTLPNSPTKRDELDRQEIETKADESDDYENGDDTELIYETDAEELDAHQQENYEDYDTYHHDDDGSETDQYNPASHVNSKNQVDNDHYYDDNQQPGSYKSGNKNFARKENVNMGMGRSMLENSKNTPEKSEDDTSTFSKVKGTLTSWYKKIIGSSATPRVMTGYWVFVLVTFSQCLIHFLLSCHYIINDKL